MPEVLIQFKSTKKPILCNQKCKKLSIAQSLAKVISKKENIGSLIVKSRNYYQEGIRYVFKVYYKIFPNIFETAYLWIKSGEFCKSS